MIAINKFHGSDDAIQRFTKLREDAIQQMNVRCGYCLEYIGGKVVKLEENGLKEQKFWFPWYQVTLNTHSIATYGMWKSHSSHNLYLDYYTIIYNTYFEPSKALSCTHFFHTRCVEGGITVWNGFSPKNISDVYFSIIIIVIFAR